MSKRGVVLHGRAREIICNVDKYFESEKQHSVTLIHELKTANISSGPDGNIIMTREIYASILQTLQNASKVTERVVLATGINKNTLTRIRREWRDAEASSSKISTPKKKKREIFGFDIEEDPFQDSGSYYLPSGRNSATSSSVLLGIF
ncbi:unnamed protein product [Parnassius mnemosyne]|uniref:Uncharacterized protein n=1 Tax=Parnassius mnemosyne TaxID=213953 RepID=A0AAV1L687_9NEOP